MLNWDHYQTWLKDQLVAPLPRHLPCIQAKDIQTDTRTLPPNSWFLPLSGKNYNGHQYITQAFSQKKALLGIAAIPPYAILTFLTLFFNISKLNAAHTEEMSSSNLFETLYALKVLF